jgi:hypothetical protein
VKTNGLVYVGMNPTPATICENVNCEYEAGHLIEQAQELTPASSRRDGISVGLSASN